MPILSALGAASVRGFGFGGGAAQAFEFVASAVAATNTITIPASAQEGDIAILYDSGVGGSPAAPSGWTLIQSLSSTFDDACSYKVLGVSDPGSSVSSFAATSYDVMAMLVFRPALPVSSVLISSDSGITQTSATPSTQTLTTTTYEPPNLLVAVYAALSGTSPAIDGAFWTGDLQVTGENNNRIHFYYEIQNDANTNRSVVATADYGTYNRMSSFVLNVT